MEEAVSKKLRRARFEEIHAKQYFGRVLDCGHKPTDPGESLYDTGIPFVTGYATTLTGRRVCYVCAAEQIRDDMSKYGNAFLYLSGDGKHIITWDGQPVAPVHIMRKTKGSFGDVRWYFRFRFNGEVWSGMGQGPGMYCRVKRTKYKGLLD